MVDVLISKDHMVSVTEAKGNGDLSSMQIYYRSHTRSHEMEVRFLPIHFKDYLFGIAQAQKKGVIADFSPEGIDQLRRDIQAANKGPGAEGSNLSKGWHQNVGP